MTTFNLPSLFVPLVGLVFPAIAMASLSLHFKRTRFSRSDGSKSHRVLSRPAFDHNSDF